jgi:hypothetical protein
MSFLDKIKDAGDKAGKAIQKSYLEQQQKAVERKEEKARQVALEQARKQKLLAGIIAPISVTVNLQQDEKAYLELTARRMASVDSVVEHTVGKTKKKGVVRRAVVGGVLLAPTGFGLVGALGGAATAGSKNKSTTTQQTVSKIQQVDSGKIILTNKRFIFIGNNNVVSLTYPEIFATSFNGSKASIKYDGMLNSEYFEVLGPAANDTQLYYKGITEHIVKSSTSG